MKRTILLLVSVLLFSCKDQKANNHAVTENSAEIEHEKSPEIQALSIIKNQFSEIEQLRKNAKLDTTSLTYNCYNERAGRVTFYSENDSLRLIEHQYNEYSHHEATNRYYVENDKPFFIFYNRLDWSFDGQSQNENDTKESISETRIYLNDEKVLKCLQKNFEKRSEEKKSSDSIPNSVTDCDKYEDYYNEFSKLKSKQGENGPIKGCL